MAVTPLKINTRRKNVDLADLDLAEIIFRGDITLIRLNLLEHVWVVAI